MDRLKQQMTQLRLLFQPWNTAPSETAIWEPDLTDENYTFKRQMISKAGEVIAAGEDALSGASFVIPAFGEQQFAEIEDELANDHEQESFLELAEACDHVVQSLIRLKA